MTSQSNPELGSTTTPQAPSNYYSSTVPDPRLARKFSNIDVPENHGACMGRFKDARTKNFVTDVWSDSAWCAVDLNGDEIKWLLEARRPSRLQDDRWIETRWMNFWGGDLQTHAVGAVADHYGLTPRLKGLLCAAAVQSGPSTVGTTQNVSHPSSASSEEPSEKLPDEESTLATSALPSPRPQSSEDTDLSKIKWGHIVNEIWHWHSVDWGQKYLCLGYNSVFTVKGVKLDNGSTKPEGKRIWTWLILCDDGTVISVYEDPFPQMTPDARVLKTVRRNVLNVFHHLSSLCNTAEQPSSLMTVQIRDFNLSAQMMDTAPPLETASRLFHYLFDDWITTHGLVDKRENPYGKELERLRSGMLTVAKIDLIDNLHQIGRRLAVLKRVYQSYEQMITRILQRQRLLRDEARKGANGQPGTRPAMAPADQLSNEQRPNLYHSSTMQFQTSEDLSLGVRLSSSAIVRFERLLDRIKLYAISEIEECVTEKESLVFMNFNLIQLKEAQAVEKLTRITILLAKATILFLPVSLMTGYFSVQITDIQGVYTIKTYWLCFLVIAVLSIMFLIIFGYASDTVEGRTVYKSLWRTFVVDPLLVIGRRTGKQKHS